MKKYLLFLVSIFIISSCSSDEDSTPIVVEPSIIGSWELIKYGTINNNIETLSDYQNVCNNKKDYVQYLVNGTADRYTYDNNCSESISTFTWTKNGNIISTESSISLETEIIELTNTKLKLKFELFGVVSTNEFRRK